MVVEEERGSGASLKEVCHDLKLPIKINPEWRPIDIQILSPTIPEKKRKFRCCMCGTEYPKQTGYFLSGGKSPLWKGNNGFLPFCKSCGALLMENMTEFYGGNEEHALKYLCHVFDWFYDPLASSMTLTQVHKGKSRLPLYPAKATTVGVSKRGSTYLDTERVDADARDRKKLAAEAAAREAEEAQQPEVTPEMVRFWGAGYRPEDYIFMQAQYDDWVERNECKTKSQEELFKMLAMAQLNVQIAQREGGKATEAMKAFQDLLGSANLKPNQVNDNAIADSHTLGTLIKEWEKTKPIPEAAPEWQDVDGIKKYFDTWFLGHLSRTLGLKNDNTEAYERELAKYTVTKPQTARTEEDMSNSTLFDSALQTGSTE